MGVIAMKMVTKGDNITGPIALDILREAKSLMDMASPGVKDAKLKRDLETLRRKLWGIIRKLKGGK